MPEKKRSMFKELDKAFGIDPNKQSVKLTQAPKIKSKEKGRYQVPIKFAVLQADLIYMREDKKGYNYILTVVDVASRLMDAIPLKGRTNQDVIEGFNQVWKHKIILENKVLTLYTDPGSEFKNKEVMEYFDDKAIDLRFTMTGRKNQTAIVEHMNFIITKQLGKAMTSKELETGEHSDEWSEKLPKLVKTVNSFEKEPMKLEELFKDPIVGKNEEILPVGTVVHVKLQKPIEHLSDKKQVLHGGFRNGDIRFDPKVTKIVNVVVVPNQPIRYIVEKYNNVSFLRKELLLADEQGQAKQKENDKVTEQKKEVKQKEQESKDELINVGRMTRGKAKRKEELEQNTSSNSKYPHMVTN